jgi:hemolysin III
MRLQTSEEEFYNSITHGLGFLLSVVGFILLLVFRKFDTFWGLIGIILYGLSLSILYLISTLYHYEQDVNRKKIYRKLDHISIYLLIAGTYSPVVLIALKNSLGWILFWIVWLIAVLGTILKVFFTGRFEIISILFYLIMGWLVMLDFSALREAVDLTGLILLFSGGMAYTLGIIFYSLDSIKYSHVVWHIFVLCGSILHYFFIFLKII